MGIFSGLFRSRDKPKDSYDSPSYSYFFGRTHAGKRVNDRTCGVRLRESAVGGDCTITAARLPIQR